MTWLAEAQRPNRLCYVLASGAFYDSGGAQTSTCLWATSYVKSSGGLYDGRLLDPGTLCAGFPETVGGPPERVSTTITVDITDGRLRALLLGTSSADPANEYASDSVLNLRLTLYHGIRAADGTLHQQQISPTMHSAGSITFTETTATIPLASRDEEILGPPAYVHTLRDIKNSTDGGFADGESYSELWGTKAWTQARATAVFAEKVAENLDAVAPILVGRAPFRLIRAAPVLVEEYFGGSSLFVVGVTKTEPTISTFSSWRLRAETNDSAFPFSHSGRGDVGPSLLLLSLIKIKRRCTLTTAPGVTVTSDVWVVLLSVSGVNEFRSAEHETLASAKLYIIPSTNVAFGMTAGRASNPVQVIRQLVDDWSQGGSARVDGPSFARSSAAHRSLAGCFGGTIGDSTSLAEVFTHIAESAGLTLWVGRDNKLHCLANGAWDASDVTAAATELPHLRSDDVLGNYTETIPRGSDDRGAALSRLTIEWTDQQREFWGPGIQRHAPGSTTLPLSYVNEGRASGAWVFPPKAPLVFAEAGARRSYVTRQIAFIAPIWVAAYELGQLFRLSYSLGIGTGTAAGYTQRLVRLTRIELRSADDTCLVSLDDLGPVAAVKPCVLDTIENWYRYHATNPIIAISVTAGSPTVTATNWNPVAAGLAVGDNLWCFGLTDSRDRRSVRVSGNIAAGAFDVDFNFYATQAGLAASAADKIDAPWIVMKTQATKSPTNTTKLTLCREGTALFDDGATSGFKVMGG